MYKFLRNIIEVSNSIKTDDIINKIKSLPSKEKTKLKMDLDELNDFILVNYPEYYNKVIRSVKYSVSNAEDIILKEIAKRL